MDGISYSKSLAQGAGCLKEHKVMNDMKDFGSCELRPLDVVNRSVVWMRYMKDSWSCIHGSKCYEQVKVIDDTNDSRS